MTPTPPLPTPSLCDPHPPLPTPSLCDPHPPLPTPSLCDPHPPLPTPGPYIVLVATFSIPYLCSFKADALKYSHKKSVCAFVPPPPPPPHGVLCIQNLYSTRTRKVCVHLFPPWCFVHSKLVYTLCLIHASYGTTSQTIVLTLDQHKICTLYRSGAYIQCM